MDQQYYPHKSESPMPLLPGPIQTRICSSPAGLSTGRQQLSSAGTEETLTESESSGWLGGLFGRIRSAFRNWDNHGNKGMQTFLPIINEWIN